MNRVVAFIYGVVAYACFFGTILYAIGFTGNIVVPKGIDSGPPGPLGLALFVDTMLLGLFAAQHSVMARPWFKVWWMRFVPNAVERSTFVFLSSLCLMLLFWQWRPVLAVMWEVENSAGRFVLWSLFWLGWALVFVSTFLIDHFDLFGLRQVYLCLRGRPYTPPEFKATSLYKIVRHPLLLGFMIAFWSAPRMTYGHFFFATITTAYMLIAIQLEEQDLTTFHGEAYERYRREVRMILPLPKKNKDGAGL
jgi:protein-S-isoprenylcysteine O-methyltransferase Ste14